jgi:ABC-type ATPase with predicted acetyltransferase domain
MSQYMQIDIRVIPFYERRFEKRFPHIADLLRRMSRKELVEKDTSFYEMADALESIADSPDTPSGLRDAISPYVEKIMRLKEVAREHLLARRLNELDQALYRMEDGFEDLEGAL